MANSEQQTSYQSSQRYKPIQHRKAVYQTNWQIKRRINRLFMILFALIGAHTLAMVWLEELSLFNALWLTLTTLTTVGYGDLSAATPAGKIATIGLLYITGITLLTLIVSDYIDYRFFKRELIRTGKWRWNMINHILIINSPRNHTTEYYIRLVSQIRAHALYRSTPIQILTDQFPGGLPTELAELGVVHYHGSSDNPGDLRAVNVHAAKHIVILARDENSAISDSATFDVLHRLMEHKLADKAIVECVRDENRERLKRLGAQAIIRPVRSYPEILVRAILAPGSEKILEDLFSHEQDHPTRYDVKISGLTWAEIVCALIQAGLGTAMAYVDEDKEVICHPKHDERIDAHALIVLVKADLEPAETEIQEAIRHYRQRKQNWDRQKQALEREADIEH
ncbi:ion transport 2 domain-containing protein [Oleiphilus messinensis]|uniref:Ion transport 2 domain-containing protein n=1 Tax=Oleiphilus messinensis TaxID=141451 RepID=A0A1Y0I302_9GAMM|nr:potassium channel family protein [Oleiphilus messinensis]ARU54837.1 ion transport 2 domain-containing protein [Oleiphilus messinensis]